MLWKCWRPLLLAVIFGFIGVAHAAPAAQPVDYRFGIIETFVDPGAASEAGAGWTRVVFQWAQVQGGGPGTWSPDVGSATVDGELAAGRQVVGLLIGVPGWAKDEVGMPAGLYLHHTDPNNLWATYVREAATRYNGRINHWIIWNEPDIWDTTHPAYSWHGTPADFAQLLKVSYLTLKETNPSAVVHMSAFTYFWDANFGREQYFGRVLDAIKADPEAAANNYYFDAATTHLYFHPSTIYNLIQAFYVMMNSRGIYKPVWVLETNAPPIDDPSWPVDLVSFPITQEEQAAFIPQVLSLSLAAGAQRIAIFKMRDRGSDRAGDAEPFGLVREDGSRRPAFDTYKVAVRWMAGTEKSSRRQFDNVSHVRLTQGDQTTHVLYSRVAAPQTAFVPATAATAIMADQYGNEQLIQAQNGSFAVSLNGAACNHIIAGECMIGGPAVYVRQSASGGEPLSPGAATGRVVAPAPTIDPALVPTQPPAATPAASPTINLTPSVTPTPAPTSTPTITRTPLPTIVPSATRPPTLAPTATVTPEPSETATNEPSATPLATLLATEPAAVAQLQPTLTVPAASDTAAPDQPSENGSIWGVILIGLGVIAAGSAAWWFTIIRQEARD